MPRSNPAQNIDASGPTGRPAAPLRSRSELQVFGVRMQPLGYAAASRSGLGGARLVAAARMRQALERAAAAAAPLQGGATCKLVRSAS